MLHNRGRERKWRLENQLARCAVVVTRLSVRGLDQTVSNPH